MSIPALGGDREGEASDFGTVALQVKVCTWLDPSEEAEDGEARSRGLRPGDGLPTPARGGGARGFSGREVSRGHPLSAGPRGWKLLALAAS